MLRNLELLSCIRNWTLFLCQSDGCIHFLSCKSTVKSKCEHCTLFPPSTRAQNILITVFVAEMWRRLTTMMRKYTISLNIPDCNPLSSSSSSLPIGVGDHALPQFSVFHLFQNVNCLRLPQPSSNAV